MQKKPEEIKANGLLPFSGSFTAFFFFPSLRDVEKNLCNLCHLNFFQVFVCSSIPLLSFLRQTSAAGINFFHIFQEIYSPSSTLSELQPETKRRSSVKRLKNSLNDFPWKVFLVSWKIAKCCFYVRLSVLQNLFSLYKKISFCCLAQVNPKFVPSLFLSLAIPSNCIDCLLLFL